MKRMRAFKKTLIITIIFIVAFFSLSSCNNVTKGGNSYDDEDSYVYPEMTKDIQENSDDILLEEIKEDTYEQDCIKCAYYFCAPLDEVWQKEICIDYCTDAPIVVLESECIELLECDPTTHILENNIPCTTEDGYPGIKDKTCEKGQIYYTDCRTECVTEKCNGKDDDCDGEVDEGFSEIEEICNNIDDNCNGIVDEGDWGDCEKLCGPGENLCIAGQLICKGPEPEEEVCNGFDDDCDGEVDEGVSNACGECGKEPEEICNGFDDNCNGEIDEGQLNACGVCGPVDDELCDGLDNDCDGLIDEELIGMCSTDCEENLNLCVGGNWLCTAKQPLLEICNGLDDDCDGKVDEGLNCLCSVNDLGALFPCQEDPLICGAGYKTCECANAACTKFQLTECLAVCHWLPQTNTPGTTCDIYLGEIKPEECNNHDDNCNQLVDEDIFASCYSGSVSTMMVGICLPGEMTCETGKWGHYDDNNKFKQNLCLGEVTPEKEDLCNGTDTNCDGKIDEDKKLEPTDILFIIDWSGSMINEINAVTAALNYFATHYSDSEVVKWGIVLTAVWPGGGIGAEQVILKTDLVEFQSFMTVFQTLNFTFMGGLEQNYDAMYLSIHNLVGAAAIPYQIADLEWTSGTWGSSPNESIPPKEQWNISWRSDAKHVIVLFSDEQGQSYFEPSITESILVDMIGMADELAVYAFSTNNIISQLWGDNYVPLTQAGFAGKMFKLSSKAIEMYNNLLEILDETACATDE